MLKISIENNFIEMIKSLLKDGFKVNQKDENGDTMLIYAAEYGKNEIARYLLQNSADVNITNNQGKTALGVAVEKNNFELVELLNPYSSRKTTEKARSYSRNPEMGNLLSQSFCSVQFRKKSNRRAKSKTAKR